MAIVSTGQITIVDNNDAKPITAFITASPSTQQTYTKDESTTAYLPDWTTANANTGLVLTAKVYVGGATTAIDVMNTTSLYNRKWSTNLTNFITTQAGTLISANAQLAAGFVQGAGFTFSAATATAAASTLTIKSNMLVASPAMTIYFEADYMDPATSLVSHVIAQISLSLVKTGTNAVYILTTGQDIITQSDTATKNSASITADLMRSSGVDNTGTTYKWTDLLDSTVISTAYSGYATKFGFRTTAQVIALTAGSIGTGVPANVNFNDTKGILISELAITNFGLYKVEITDADGTIYSNTFTVYDVTDPYTTELISTSGDKLQNGVGSTNIYPEVFNGAAKLSTLAGWTFNWKLFDGTTGIQGGFVDTARTVAAIGRGITTNTAHATAPTITFDGAAITFANNDMVKIINSAGVAFYYEVSTAGSVNAVTLRIPATTSTFLTAATAWNAAVTSNQFQNGKMFVCSGTGATAGVRSTSGDAIVGPTTASKITVTGYDVDVKAKIICESNRP